MGRRYEPPEGWTMQSFGYALEHGQPAAAAVAIERSFGARRFSHNWTVQSISDSIAAYRETGQESPPPSLASLRKEWNRAKDEVAADSGTGEAWWPGISKEVFNDGIAGAVDGYWNWQKSRAGARAGRPVGFPKRHRKNRRRDSFTICQPSRSQKGIRIADNRHLRIPVVGVVRTCESMRNLARLVERGMARIMAVTASRKGGRLHASLRVEVLRPQRHHRPSRPDSRVGVDIGERCLAVVADSDGTIIETVENPAPLKKSLAKLRRLNRKLSRQKKGSNGWNNTRKELNRLHRRIACTRDDALHKLTTRLAKTHGAIVIEDLNVAGMRKGGAKHLRDAAFGEFRRKLAYKTSWYGSVLILADRWYPSSKTCSACGHVQTIGRKKQWDCDGCGTHHDRDRNAAVNLARWEPKTTQTGPVGSGRTPAVRSGGEGGDSAAGGTGIGPAKRAPGLPRGAPQGATPQGVAA